MASVPLAHPTTWETPRNLAKAALEGGDLLAQDEPAPFEDAGDGGVDRRALLPVVERQNAEGNTNGRSRGHAHAVSDTAPSGPRS